MLAQVLHRKRAECGASAAAHAEVERARAVAERSNKSEGPMVNEQLRMQLADSIAALAAEVGRREEREARIRAHADEAVRAASVEIERLRECVRRQQLELQEAHELVSRTLDRTPEGAPEGTLEQRPMRGGAPAVGVAEAVGQYPMDHEIFKTLETNRWNT